jgi:hypothetical protein
MVPYSPVIRGIFMKLLLLSLPIEYAFPSLVSLLKSPSAQSYAHEQMLAMMAITMSH